MNFIKIHVFIKMDINKKQQELEKFKQSLEGKNLEELEKMEQDVIKKLDKNDEKLKKTEYNLPGDNYSVVAKEIRNFVNKKTVQWQYTLAMVGIYDFWDPENKPEKISYYSLESVLRILGEMQFTGYEEWAAVIAINKYFEPLQKQFAEATEKTYDLSAQHNEIMQAMDKFKPIGDLEK